MANWQDLFDHEIENAYLARTKGKEGRARVCARRAAGILAEEYLQGIGFESISQNAIENISLLLSIGEISLEAKVVLSHFLIRVDIDHTLPKEVDLIRDAVWLRDAMISDK